MIHKISKILNSVCSQWIIILSNGKIIETSMEDKNLGKIKILRILKAVINDMEVGSVIIVKNIVIFRLTFEFFIFLIGEFSRNILKKKFYEISTAYKFDIKQKFEKKKSSKNIKIKLIVFSMTLDEGPIPIYYFPETFEDDIAYKVSMKSLLLLSVETFGANKDMISFQPFVDLNSLGIVFLFQVKDSNARGGVYDSAITVLVDYKFRGVIYENYTLVEEALIEAKNKFINAYKFEKNYNEIIKSTIEHFNKISIENVKHKDIKSNIIEQIKKVSKL